MTKNLLLTLLFILASSAILSAKNDGPKIQGWVEKGEYKESAFKDDSILFMKYSADGKKLFTMNTSGIFRELDVATGETIRELKTLVHDCLSIDYEEDADILVLSSIYRSDSEGYILTCYSKGTMRYQDSFKIYHSDFNYLKQLKTRICLDSRNSLIFYMYYAVINGGYYEKSLGAVKIHNLEDGKYVKTCIDDSIEEMEISPDKNFLFLSKYFHEWESVGGNGSATTSKALYLYDKATDSVRLVEKDLYEDALSFSWDSKQMVTYRNDSIIKRNISNSNIVGKVYARFVNIFKQSLNVKAIIALNNRSSYDYSPYFFSIYDYDTGFFIKGFKPDSIGNRGSILDLSPDSSSIAIFSIDGKIRIYNTDINKRTQFIVRDLVSHTGDTCQYLDRSAGSPKAWSWDFGDGTTSTEQNPKHVYQKPGLYSIRLITSFGTFKDTSLIKDYIKILPLINLKISYQVENQDKPLKVTFKCTSDVKIERFDWNFGDRTYTEYFSDSIATHNFSSTGKFLPRIKYNDGFHDHEFVFSDSIELSYPKPKLYDVLFEKETLAYNNGSCGFVSGNGDLVFGFYPSYDYRTEKIGQDYKSFYKSSIYRYTKEKELKVKEFNNRLHNFVELPNGDYFLLGSYDYNMKYYNKEGYSVETRISEYLYNKTTDGFSKVYSEGSNFGYCYPYTKANIIDLGNSGICYQVQNPNSSFINIVDNSAKKYSKFFPYLNAISVFNDSLLLACVKRGADTTKLYIIGTDFKLKDSVIAKIDSNVYINKILYSEKYGYFLIGYKDLGTNTLGAIYLYDKSGKQKLRYIKKEPNSEFLAIKYLGNADYAVAGKSGETMGIEFVNADSLTVNFVPLTGRSGIINVIDKTNEGNIFIVGSTVNNNYTCGYAALLGVSKILGVSEETPRQTGTNSNLFVSQSSDIALISYSLSHSSSVSLKLYDMLGRPVATVFEGDESEGTCRHEFQTSAILPGIYLIRLESADGQVVAKIAVGR